MVAQVQQTLFPVFQSRGKNEYLSLKRQGLPFRSKIKASYESIKRNPNKLDQFIAEATAYLEHNDIETRLHNRPDAKQEALQAAYFYLMQAHFYRSLDRSKSRLQIEEDQRRQAHYSSLISVELH